MMSDLLTHSGSLVTFNIDLSASPPTYPNIPKTILKTFQYASVMHFFVPSFVTDFRLVVASKRRSSRGLPKDELRKTLAPFMNDLWYYDEETHLMIFTLPKHSRRDMHTTY